MNIRSFLKHIYILGIKEIKSFFNDKVFLVFVIWGFTLNIIVSANAGNMDVKNAAVAVVMEDDSLLSKNIVTALRQPYFKTPDLVSYGDIEDLLDKGKYVFIITIPENFESNLVAGKPTEIQLNVDATAISLAYVGSGYIKQIISKEINTYLDASGKSLKKASQMQFDQVVRVKYNPNMKSEWFMSVAQIIIMSTMLSMMLPAVALVREKESGTIEHLLVMPIIPQEIMLSKIWSNSLIILCFAIMSMLIVVKGHYGLQIEGSLLLYFVGFVIFQFSVTSLGIVLATFVNNTAQLALSIIVVMMPMVFLSGAYTPMESMTPLMQKLMFISPLKHCMDFSFAVIFRAATLADIYKPMIYMIITGIVLFVSASIKFNSWFNSSR